MSAIHLYNVQLNWTGNIGQGTQNYSAYERSYVVSVQNKPGIPGSADLQFRGDRTRYNPEELLVASLSSCHMLWFLHICSAEGIIVTAYEDDAKAVMEEDASGGGRFIEVVLRPKVGTTAATYDAEKINALHATAHEKCFIANSVNFPVSHEPVCYAAE